MSASSLLVVLNALRLADFRQNVETPRSPMLDPKFKSHGANP